jgi:release factor glutamine methyltransferase
MVGSNGTLGSQLSVTLAQASGDDLSVPSAQASILNSVPAQEHRRAGWAQMSSQSSSPLTVCYATTARKKMRNRFRQDMRKQDMRKQLERDENASMVTKPEVKSFLNTNLALSVCLQDYLKREGVVRGKSVLDIGSGEGSLVQYCLDAGAEVVCGIDISEEAVANSARNVPAATFAKIDCADGAAVHEFIQKNCGACGPEVVVCNPAQIPLPQALPNGYFVGEDGRGMITEVLRFAKASLPTNAVLFIVHSSLSDWEKTLAECSELDLQAEVVNGTLIEYPLYPEVNTESTQAHLKKVCGFDPSKHLVSGCVIRIQRREAFPKSNGVIKLNGVSSQQ